ncbi:hypothetical protein BUALT_Bualt05G0027800 [Buddleja alternifolia]|uniref:Ubiquitinyl hydrolase 1 n=1 Tax=Buddleja alternifolia TaxID=168488 RepID=A0AAV6XHI4_9LAMI|nr:hypothetical protein BUALT_Bualt05G0027800 [Buddleja alternifolia]
MHVAVDLNWFLQFIVLALAAAFGFLYLVRSAASRYFVVDSNFDSSAADFSADRKSMAAPVAGVSDACAVCGLRTTKHCAGCKMVKYCSAACQKSHWASEHKVKCKDLLSFYKSNHTKSTFVLKERNSSVVRAGGRPKTLKQSNKILFPYEQFVNLFSWDKPDYPPCGLLNCGNSCFANAVLQCLAYTRPLAAYLLEKGHKIECQMDDWCFLCEFQTHVERTSRSRTPFSPINILSRLPNIGGNLGYGKQEDAHEFMRFAIDMMQSVCLDEFGGEKAVHPSYQETTLIQHIFGGHLQSQVICTECNNVSNQFENMMDLSVEIHGDAGSLEECLDQFTAKEWLHGDNMYRCDGCNAYVKAWKRLTIHRAPNILTIALKRFQSGRFGKLNKRVTFPETLDLSPYMSEIEDGNDIYKLYAVIVHLDMLNASYFGHYISYVKGFCGNWYRIDDCKVANVDLDEVLSQGAYMLMYRRIRARRSCLLPAESLIKQETENVKLQIDPSQEQPAASSSGHLSNANHCTVEVNCDEELSSVTNAENANGGLKMVSSETSLPIVKDIELRDSEGLSISQRIPINNSLIDNNSMQSAVHSLEPSSISDVETASRGGITNACEGLLRMSTEESTENGTFETNNNNCDVSPVSIANGDVLDEMKPTNSTSMLKNGEFGNGSLSTDKTKDAAKKSNVVKLKPLFAPGFLGKNSRKGFTMQEDKVSVHPNNHTNEDTKPCLFSENGGLLKDEKPGFVLVNGTVPMESVLCERLENGGSGHPVASG